MTTTVWPIEEPLELAEVYRAHAAIVARWAVRLGGPSVDAEDVVHDVFLVVERRLPEFRGDAQLSTWIYRITALVVRRHLRRARLRGLFGWLDRRAEAVPSLAPSPLEAAEASQAVLQLYRALDELPEKYRTALILHELEGLPAVEIAELTGVEPSTVWVRLHRGRRRLEELLARTSAGARRVRKKR